MKNNAYVVEVNKKERTARCVASFENCFMAEIAERAFNEMVGAPWYNGKKVDIVYCWTPEDIQAWATAYGYLIV